MSPDDEVLYNTTVRFNSIYVLQSLGEGEAKTGRDLYDSVIYPAKVRLGEMHTEFLEVPTSEALVAALRAVAHSAKVGNHHPILHVEAHGGPGGIELADGTVVMWKDLIPLLREINLACKNNLIVVAIACSGWSLTESLMPSDRAPVFMLVGPPGSMAADDLLAASQRFYTTLTTAFDIRAALDAMNDGRAFAAWTVRPATAEILFCRVFRRYVAEFGSGDALRARENAIVADVARAHKLTVVDTALLRSEVRADLIDHRAAYDRMRTTFLMLDLFPDDRSRFGLTYDLCGSEEGGPPQ